MKIEIPEGFKELTGWLYDGFNTDEDFEGDAIHYMISGTTPEHRQEAREFLQDILAASYSDGELAYIWTLGRSSYYLMPEDVRAVMTELLERLGDYQEGRSSAESR